MSGYMTLDCRDGVHAGCAVCSCRCHGERAVPWGTRSRFDPLILLFVLSALAAVLIVLAVLLGVAGFGHSPAPMVTDVQLVTQ